MTGLTGYLNVGQEIHLDDFHTCALASLTPPSFDIKRKPPGFVTPDFRFGKLHEQGADIRKHARVGRWIGSCCTADRALVNLDHLIDILQPLDFLIGKGSLLRSEKMLVEYRIQRFGYQAGLAATGHACYHREGPQRKRGR